MNSRLCASIQSSFSEYLDGAISGRRMQEISQHIEGSTDAGGVRHEGCVACASELAAWRIAQNALVALGPAKAPADLPLKLRIAISHELAHRDSRVFDRLSLAWNNIVRPRLVQVSAGIAGSMVLGSMVLLLGVVAAPQPVLANDEPLGAMTAPHFRYFTYSPGDTVTPRDTPIVVEAQVNARGQVYDYTIVSGSGDAAVRARVEGQLLSSVFEPASAFGVPVRGHVVITFAGISVHG
jgi:hypothetical protein